MTIEWFLKNVVMKDLGRTVFTPGLQFLSFGIMGPTIEFLGACFDTKDLFKPGLSEDRFRKAIDSLDSLQDYRPYNIPPTSKRGPYPPHDLFSNMRCGMAHIGSPGLGVAFTERGNPDEWDKHLQIWEVDHRTHRERLILGAWEIRKIKNRSVNRMTPVFHAHISSDRCQSWSFFGLPSPSDRYLIKKGKMPPFRGHFPPSFPEKGRGERPL
jgi:hypothetical protein